MIHNIFYNFLFLLIKTIINHDTSTYSKRNIINFILMSINSLSDKQKFKIAGGI